MNHRASFCLLKTSLLPACLLLLAGPALAGGVQLRKLFDETFEQGLLANPAFKVIPAHSGMQIDEVKGKHVIVRAGAMVVHPIHAGARVVWSLDLEFLPPADPAGKPACVGFGFVLANNSVLMARLARDSAESGAPGELQFCREDGAERQHQKRDLRKGFRDVRLADGTWELEYNQGMISVCSPAGTRMCAYDDQQNGLAIPVVGLLWEQQEGSTKCRHMSAGGSEPLRPVKPEADAELKRAAELNRQAQTSSRAGDWDAALAAMREASDLFLKHRGENSRDYANSLANLGGMHFAKKEYLEALRIRERVRTLYTRLLGPEHPRTGLSLAEAAQCLAELRRWDEALTSFREAARVVEMSMGPEDQLVQSLKTTIARGQDAKAGPPPDPR